MSGTPGSGGLRAGAALAVLLKWIVLVFFLAVAVLPLAWLVLNSFKTNLEIQSSPFSLPARPDFENYANAVALADLP
ncbi:MAG TPA: carbohydrate ABC transporter permease, partial [Spirochaetia bacterium]|nr:carbohydrate ABC transporter permease [Spirochaetia bacterium]